MKLIKTAIGDLLEIHEAAEMLGYRKSTLYVLNCKGGGPKYYRVGPKCGYKLEDLRNWMESNRVAQ